eukprot:2806360-Rhodomonas_salina.1
MDTIQRALGGLEAEAEGAGSEVVAGREAVAEERRRRREAEERGAACEQRLEEALQRHAEEAK